MPNATIKVLTDESLGTISPMVHGHFAEHLGRCCNDGLWVGPSSPIPNVGGLRTDILSALRDLGVPQLRWPGGCYADTYHWRDGIGPMNERPRSLGESCGLRVVEDNGLGTHEFIALCREIGAEPYLAGNVGSGSPQEMMDWLHYCNGVADTTLAKERANNGHPESMNVKYWGVGNENWGCGGNYDAVDYAKEYRRYSTFLKQVDPTVELIACGGNQDNEWNLRLVETLRNNLNLLDHVSLHQYYVAGHATEFTEPEYYQVMRAGDLVDEDMRAIDELLSFFTAGKRHVGVAFDEWGVWHPQAAKSCDYEAPNTLRDAVAAAGVLDTFHKWCSRVSMANLAQIVNVLQTLIQTDEDRMWLTPTYHLFMLYKPHRGAQALRTVVECDSIEAGKLAFMKPGLVGLVSASASQTEQGLALSLSNRHMTEPMEVTVSFRGDFSSEGREVTVTTLSGDAANAVNSAEEPARVKVESSSITGKGAELRLQLPPCSIQTVVFL
jgi:alpha-N-arabinofuranosidase